jgi:hypothetical protein
LAITEGYIRGLPFATNLQKENYTIDGTPAVPVMGPEGGVRNIIPMLHLTRTWNSIAAAATMRRGMALARDYARRRMAFGAPLSQQPLHTDTLAGLQAETEAAFHLTFYLVELLGRDETGEATPEEGELLRLLTSMVKLTTGRQGVAVLSEVLEAHGGAGYVEDTGLPLLAAHRTAVAAVDHAVDWVGRHASDRTVLEAGARRFALTLGRALALLVEQAAWSLGTESDGRPRLAALRFAAPPVDVIQDETADWSALVDDGGATA